jgi:hypothetical protein
MTMIRVSKRNHLLPFFVAPLLACVACGDGGSADAAGITVTISGEDAAREGFLYPTGSEVTFADGWELHFEHVLVTVGAVTLSENPDHSPVDQSQTGGLVARADGPFAVDLTAPGDTTGAGGEGEALTLTAITAQNLGNGEPFALDRRYAFGFSVVRATADAERVGFEPGSEADQAYERMIERGEAVLYLGTAEFKGQGCETGDASYPFDELPAAVPFELGFATPTTYRNCQNQENDGEPFDGEEYQRGVAMRSDRRAAAQITLHLEHPFFSDAQHDSALHFDPMAARLGATGGTTLTLDDLAGVELASLSDAGGTPLPPRVCDGSPLPPGAVASVGVGSVPVDPSGDPARVLRDFRDFVEYVQSTQAHLNGGEGLCSVRRDYPSPR